MHYGMDITWLAQSKRIRIAKVKTTYVTILLPGGF